MFLGPQVARVSAAQQHPPLADLARKEAERRKTIKDPQKVITAKDLPESARREREANPLPDASAGGSDASSAVGAKPATDPNGQKTSGGGDSSQKDEAYWRNRLTQAQESLHRSEMFLSALQSQINGLTTDFVNRDDPYQRAKIAEDRQNALAEMERVKGDIEKFKKQVADIEEDARRAGVPPGWLR